MINKENGFDLNIRWRFLGGREYAFAFIVLFVFLIVIYGNSFKGQFVFDDTPNIVENKNIQLKSLEWSEIKKSFYGIEGKKISRPLSYLSLALNYYFGGLNVFGYHLVNFIIHYFCAVFLFLFIYNTLQLPSMQERFGKASYSIALLSVVLWATSPLQVTAVTYIVQRMASMAGLFYIKTMYYYLKARTAQKGYRRAVFWSLCALSALAAFGSKQNAVMLPFSIWLFDLLLIQGATRENIIRNLKVLVPVIVVVGAIGLWYVDLGALVSGEAYKNRPFTLAERLLTQPRVIIFYITLLLYPVSSRLTLIHDIELSTSLLSPWTTLVAILVIGGFLVLAGYLARRRPLISFSIFFYFLNHVVESSFLPLELIFEHRNYIPSMFFFVPVAMGIIYIVDYFSYKKVIQYTATAVFAFFLFAQGHSVFARGGLFSHPILLWTDNVEKAPTLSRPYNNLGTCYAQIGHYDIAYNNFKKAYQIKNPNNLTSLAVYAYNIGKYLLEIKLEYENALKFFEKSILIDLNFRPAVHSKAVCLIKKGKLVEAKKLIEKALLKWPKDAKLNNNYAFVLLKNGNYHHALKRSLYTLQLDPGQYTALAIAAVAEKERKNYNKSILYWEKYLQQASNNIYAICALIELYTIKQQPVKVYKQVVSLLELKGLKNWDAFWTTVLVDKKFDSYPLNTNKTQTIVKETLNKLFIMD